MLTNACWLSMRAWGFCFSLSFGACDHQGARHWTIALQIGPLNVATDYVEIAPN